MSEFRVTGRFVARDGWQAFEKRLEAPNAEVAREYALSEFGSKHNLKRTQVDIEEVTAA